MRLAAPSLHYITDPKPLQTWHINTAVGTNHYSHTPTPIDRYKLSFSLLAEHWLCHRPISKYLQCMSYVAELETA